MDDAANAALAQVEEFLDETTAQERELAVASLGFKLASAYAKYTRKSIDTAIIYLKVADRQTSSAEIAAKVAKVMPVIGTYARKLGVDSAISKIDGSIESILSNLKTQSNLLKFIEVFGKAASIISGAASGALITMRKSAELAELRLQVREGAEDDDSGPPDQNALVAFGFDDFAGALDAADADLDAAYAAVDARYQAAVAPTTAYVDDLVARYQPVAQSISAVSASMEETRLEFRAVVDDVGEAVDDVEDKASDVADAMSVFAAPIEAIFSFFTDPPSISIPFIGTFALFAAIPRETIERNVGAIVDFFDDASGFITGLLDPILSYVLGPVRGAIDGLVAKLNPFSGVTAEFDALGDATEALTEELQAARAEVERIEVDLRGLASIPLPDSPAFGAPEGATFDDPARVSFFGTDADDYVQGAVRTGPAASPSDVSGAVLAGGGGDDRLFGTEADDVLLGEDGDDDLVGRAGRDVLSGGGGDDRLFGSDGDDLLFGGFGDDLLRGDNSAASPGDDVLVGGGGYDTAAFDGVMADYVIERVSGGIIVTGPEGRDHLTEIELLRFADGTVEGDPEYVLFGNVAPTIAPGAADVVQGAGPVTVDLTLLGDDPNSSEDGTTLIYALVDAPTGATVDLSGADLRFEAGAAYRSLPLGETVVEQVTVTAEDRFGLLSAPQAISFAVIGVNDAPEMADAVARVAKDSDYVTVDLAALGSDVDADEDAQALIYAIAAGPSAGRATLSDSFLEFSPSGAFADVAEGEVRQVEIGVQATDAHGAVSNVAIVRVAVTGALDQPNNAPSFVGLSQPFVAENSRTGTLVGRVISYDVDDDRMTYELAKSAGGRFKLDGDRLLVAKSPNYERSQEETITLAATDAFGARTTQEVSISVIDEIEGGKGRDKLSGGAAADRISGLGGRDDLKGRGGDDLLRGGGGKDALDGGGGNDVLIGDRGADRMSGGGGRDMLLGGKGADRLSGGGGADVFRFQKGDGKDTIADFRLGKDKVEVGSGAARFGQLDISRDGKDAVVEFANVEITLEKVKPGRLDADDFIF